MNRCILALSLTLLVVGIQGVARADGLALSDSWASCVVTTENLGTDRDNDGVFDDCEFRIASAFQPRLIFSKDETARARHPYWSALPTSQGRIRVFYALSYENDSGDPETLGIFSTHYGDSEFIVLNVAETSPGLWALESAFLSAHYESWCSTQDGTEITNTANDLEYEDGVKYGRPLVYVAEGKHANYASLEECELGCHRFDHCQDGKRELTGISADGDLGLETTSYQIVNEVSISVNSSVYKEWYWETGEKHRFCGWQVEDTAPRVSCVPEDNNYYRELNAFGFVWSPNIRATLCDPCSIAQVCVSGTCKPCGSVSDLCCEGMSCGGPGLACTAGYCRECGGLGQGCCATGCLEGGTLCIDGVCKVLASLSCADRLQDQGEIGVDCGGPCPPCAPSCNDGLKNQVEFSTDCGGPCTGLMGYCPYGPNSDGWYCGDASRGQNPESLYYCSKGIWDPSKVTTCGTAGCKKAGVCQNDSCDAPAVCGNTNCEVNKGENCSSCLADCQVAAPALGTASVGTTSVQLPWTEVACGNRYRIKVCSDVSMMPSSCITSPGSAVGTCELAPGTGTVTTIGRSQLDGHASWYWQAAAIGSAETYGWGPWSAQGSFNLPADVGGSGGATGSGGTGSGGTTGAGGVSGLAGRSGTGGTTVICGNNVREGTEPCDGTDLAGENCETRGWVGGTLSCQADCANFNESLCCVDGCLKNPGARCADTIHQQACVIGTNGCTYWGGSTACQYGCAGNGCYSPTCGDGTKQDAETCDGADLGGATCASQGFTAGVLACNASCSGLVASGCCSDDCTSGTHCASSTTQESCGQYDADSCRDWGGATTCTLGCVGFSCVVCGNGVREGSEICDGSDLGGASCLSQGFVSGTLLCNGFCNGFNASQCCASNTCNSHGSCSNSVCTCTTGYTGTTCNQCAAGYANYPNCVVTLPDLTVASFSAPSVVGVGIYYSISTTIARTMGQLVSGTYAFVRIYLSVDSTITTGDYKCSLDDSTAQFANATLNASGSLTQSVGCAPGDPSLGSLAKGTYFWGAIVDPTNFHSESDESNNVRLGGQVTVK